MIISEDEMLSILDRARRVVLLEPLYKRRYPPLGLAKIATRVKERGAEAFFQRRYVPMDEDLVCVTTLFTYESQAVFDALNNIFSTNILFGRSPVVMVGGVFASLMSEEIERRFPKSKIFVGYSKWLDMEKPDYSIDWGVDKRWTKFSYVFTSRGCPNRCAYCAVSKLEPDVWVNPKWADVIDMSKPNVMMSDNNLSAQPFDHLLSVATFLNHNRLRAMFDNGFDCKHITEKVAEVLALIPFVKFGMRLSFDRIEEDGIFQRAVQRLIDAGIRKDNMMAFCLFNFTDSPAEALYRLETVNKLGMRPYPQKYVPLNVLNRKKPYVGRYWTRKLLLAFRYFWLMRGENLHKDFRKWLHEQTRFYVTEDDFRAMETTRLFVQKKVDQMSENSGVVNG